MPLTGAAAFTRSSAAATQKVTTPPPEMPGRADAVPVHLGPRSQVIEGPHRIPALHACRGVPGRIPPPALMPKGAAMDRRDLAQFQRVQHQGDVAVRREPDARDSATRVPPCCPRAFIWLACPQRYRIAGHRSFGAGRGRYRFAVT